MTNRSTRWSINRRQALGAGGLATSLALLKPGASMGAASGTALSGGTAVSGRETTVDVTEATNVALALSPDGTRVALDLLGILWTMPAQGGPLTRLTGDFDDLALPDWSPDGARIAFQSYRSGNFHIWAVPAGGGALEQLTDGLFDDREPCWSPDGKTIAFSSDRVGGRYTIHLLDVASGAVRALSTGSSQDSEPTWTPDGTAVVYVADGTRIVAVPVAGGAAKVLAEITPSADFFHPAQLHAPAIAPDGTLAYTRIADGAVTLVVGGVEAVAGRDLYPFRPAFRDDGGFVFAADGKIVARSAAGAETALPFSARVPVTTPVYAKHRRDFDSTAPRPVLGIVGPQLSPDGREVVFTALGDIWRMTIGARPQRLVAGPDFKCDPAWSPDGKSVLYASDRGGTLQLWLRDLASGKDRQITNAPDKGLVSGAFAPDGKSVACLDQNGTLLRVTLADGTIQPVYEGLWEPGRPSFGPDGETIAYAAFKPVTPRFREGLSEILTVDTRTGKGTYTPLMEGKSLGVRGLDGPVWSPDGAHMACVFASTLWVVPVDPQGGFTGAPRQLNSEVTDAPSWSGDGQTLLYLSNGKLRRIALAGGAPETVPCRIDWALAKPAGRTVLSASALWDGLSETVASGKDVVVEGNRIAAIVPTGSVRDANARRIAGGAGTTLMPGLIDMHTHRQMQGYNYGDRMGRVFLAMGITATRSPGCPAYHMVEDREAIDSGARVAPRHYATGEAIDGGRIFYNFMRPVTEPGQLEREMERASALSYDMVKTYVRLRHDVQKQVVDIAHRHGLPLSSHYHYPALHSAMDCMEHMGATNRYGYSRTITALGGGYQDVNGLFAAAKAGRTNTLFVAQALLGLDDTLVHDPRIKILFPSWEYAKLVARVKALTGEGGKPLLASLERQVAQIKATMELGWHFLAGTDAPIDLVAISLHLNLRGMARYGVRPVDALKCATSHAGTFLDEPVGRIAPGMLADLILVRGDPLKDVAAAADVEMAMMGGAAHSPESLMKPFVAVPDSALVNPVAPALAGGKRAYWESFAYVETARSSCCADHWHGEHGNEAGHAHVHRA
ncbi:amidohydrolase family protein [Novosphingobium sp. 1949]|uniref:Amidohydrolase family protein n=1 Tax=Novosphingobium organovorum TaxID=2930092 RepID=A0ABT0BCW3_9SPHN|nr:amidohydrolase family protein [Novosphingobium organovorum]MCJ2182908.1 amidohydrolase family protein [Novosphingobium organovorum]